MTFLKPEAFYFKAVGGNSKHPLIKLPVRPLCWRGVHLVLISTTNRGHVLVWMPSYRSMPLKLTLEVRQQSNL
jgi:hypothetical protein